MKKLLPFLFVPLLLLPLLTFAQDADNSKHGIALRAIFPNHSWPLESVDQLLSNDFGAGVEFEYYRYFNDHLGISLPLRANTALVPLNEVPDTRKTSYLSIDALLNYNLMRRDAGFYPSLFAGVSGMAENLNDLELAIPLGLGLNFRLSRNTHLSLTGSYRLNTTDLRDHLQLGAGFVFNLGEGASKQPKVTDRDGDGIPDPEDLCPDQKGPAAFNGCPDTDNDGIVDGEDACPTVAGLPDLMGCPDTDGDGITDLDDACPTEAGPADNNGCPITDRDGDGVEDAADRCPDLAGPAATGGCPDGDGDGIADTEDDCPTQAGTAANGGCPDTDGDGVIDGLDACPNQAGPASNKGCPEIEEEDRELLAFAVQAVAFETGSAQLKSESTTILDQIVDIMNRYPAYKLRISGHTDSIGSSGTNQGLSERRAKSCFDYLVSKGISASRMSHTGYGESQPIADNRYKAGRDQNRRVEFDLYIE